MKFKYLKFFVFVVLALGMFTMPSVSIFAEEELSLKATFRSNLAKFCPNNVECHIYKFNLRNNGSEVKRNIVVTDNIPLGAKVIAVISKVHKEAESLTRNDRCDVRLNEETVLPLLHECENVSINYEENKIVWTISEIASGEEYVLLFAFEIEEGFPVVIESNEAWVSYSGFTGEKIIGFEEIESETQGSADTEDCYHLGDVCDVEPWNDPLGEFSCGERCNQNARARECDDISENDIVCFIGRFTESDDRRRCFDESKNYGDLCSAPACFGGSGNFLVKAGRCSGMRCIENFQLIEDCYEESNNKCLTSSCETILGVGRCTYTLKQCPSGEYCFYETGECVPFTRHYCEDVEDDCQDLNCYTETCDLITDPKPGYDQEHKECNYYPKSPLDGGCPVGTFCDTSDDGECDANYLSLEEHNPINGELRACRVESEENFTETEDYIYFENPPLHEELPDGVIDRFEIYTGKSTHDFGYWVKIASVNYNSQKDHYLIRVDPVKQLVFNPEDGPGVLPENGFSFYPDAYGVHFVSDLGGKSLWKSGIVHKKDNCPEGVFNDD